VDACVPAEPGFLASREPPGGPDGFLARFVKGELAVQVAEHLLVAQCAAGGLAVPQAVPGELPHLGLEACLPHRLDAGGDPLVEFRAGQGEAELDRWADLVVGGHGRGERAAGQLDHLEGAHDAAAVAGQDGYGRGRVKRGQPGVQHRGAHLGQLELEAGAGRRIRSVKIEIVERGTEVQA